jgi:hypothetical protein
MSHSGISIGEALSKLCAPVGGRLLPQVQGQYVWGTRQESEQYVCLLLGSLVKAYRAMAELVSKPDCKAN